MKSSFAKFKTLLIFLSPAAVFYIFFVLYPLFSNVKLSFYKWSGFSKPLFVGLENYFRILNDEIFWVAFKNNLIFTIAALTIMMVISFILAFIVNMKPPAVSFFRTIFFLPVVISTVVVGLMWSRILEPNNGSLNLVLRALGLDSLTRNWLGDPSIALISIIGVWIWRHFGYGMVLFLAGLQGIPSALIEAARIDGASNWQVVRYIIMPALRPITLVVAMWAIVYSFRVFPLIYIMTRGGPYYSTEVLNTYLYRVAFQDYNFGYGSAIATIVLVLTVLMTISRRLFTSEV